jgi:predicted O-methyltransferase YrrM
MKGYYSENWFNNNITIWSNMLGYLKGSKLEAIEIGSFEGMSAVWTLENILTNPESHLTCIDNFKGGWEQDKNIDWADIKRRFLKNTEPYKDKVELIESNSATYLKKRTKKADLIYIDGSHTTSDALTDAVLCHLLLNPAGVIIFDDYLWTGTVKTPNLPKGAIDSFLDCFPTQYELLYLGYQVIVRKKVV